MNQKKKIFFLVLYFGLPLAVVTVLLVQDVSIVSDPVLFFSMCAGIAGFTWLLLQLVLSARIRLIEENIGLDRLLAFHRTMPVVSIGLLLVHGGVKFLYYPTSLVKIIGTLAYIGFIFAGIFSVFFLAGGGGRIGKRLRDLVSKKFGVQYQAFKSMHNLTFLLSVLVFIHVFYSGLAVYTPFLRGYFLGIFLVSTAAYIYHKVIRPRNARVFEVAEVLTPSKNITTLRFTQEKGPPDQHIPGQFAFFRFPEGFPGPEEHPFTISGFPELEITVKAVGDFTGALSRLEPGTPVKVDGPYGVFSYRNFSREYPLVFIAGGIGITPFLSMLRGLDRDAGDRIPLLIWSVRREEDLVYLDELGRNCRAIPVVEDGANWEGRRGRINTLVLEEAVPEQTLREALFFLCGPPPMMKSVMGDLKKLGVPKKKIIMERFSL